MGCPAATLQDSARAERRAVAALLAVFALLVQTLVPALAAAAPGPQGLGVICAAGGHANQRPSQDGGGQPAHQPGDCDHCVCPAAAAPPPPAAAALAAPVRYASGEAPTLSPRDGPAPGRGLAAPPPPSRGPPLTI